MYVLRRHYRRLLLPPGWVALGFLLLLGCQALLTHERQLRLENVLQLTMPYLKAQAERQHQNGTPYSLMFYISPAEIKDRQNWHTADFTGMSMRDFLSAERVEAAINAIQADSSRAGGVRVYFYPGATYNNLVYLLDMMNRLHQKKYWFDIQHEPSVFYAITDKYVPVQPNIESVFTCSLGNDVFISPPAGPSSWQLLALKVSSLWQQAWRPSILLLAGIISLSFYRLTRRPRAPF